MLVEFAFKLSLKAVSNLTFQRSVAVYGATLGFWFLFVSRRNPAKAWRRYCSIATACATACVFELCSWRLLDDKNLSSSARLRMKLNNSSWFEGFFPFTHIAGSYMWNWLWLSWPRWARQALNLRFALYRYIDIARIARLNGHIEVNLITEGSWCMMFIDVYLRRNSNYIW